MGLAGAPFGDAETLDDEGPRCAGGAERFWGGHARRCPRSGRISNGGGDGVQAGGDAVELNSRRRGPKS